MSDMWGLLGPETLPSLRRTRGLGIAASVRRFNDLAVPGLGGVWFGKQIFLALLGVAVAEYVRAWGNSPDIRKISNIEVTNAVEALACWMAYRKNGWTPDPRLRGITKLRGWHSITFQQARQPGFYVTQPMRIATVQTLPALGLVEADNTRFNSFRCSDTGRRLIDAVTQGEVSRTATEGDHALWAESNATIQSLAKWVLDIGQRKRLPSADILSPLFPLPNTARDVLRRGLLKVGPDAKRRQDAWTWISSLEAGGAASWERKPVQLSEAHWHDLQAGACFFALREAAITVLDELESHMGTMASPSLDLSDLSKDRPCDLEPLMLAAQQYLTVMREGRDEDKDALVFAEECCGDDIVRALVRRDGQVLQLRGEHIVPGPAFRGSPQRLGDDTDEEDGPQPAGVPLPPHISSRVRNLWLLQQDMAGKLEALLHPEQKEDDA